MAETPSSSDISYRHGLNQALHAARILAGALDDELGIQKSSKTTKLGAQNKLENDASLNATLSDRLGHAVASYNDLSSFQLHSDPQVATGDLALHLLSRIHCFLIQKKRDIDSRVAVQDERLPAFKRKSATQPKEEVGLGVKDVKLVTTLQSLASKWALSTRIKAYDEALFSLAPKGFYRSQSKHDLAELTPNNRFQEIDQDAQVQQRTSARASLQSARTDLFSVVERWMSVLTAHASSLTSGNFLRANTTDVVTVMLRVGIVDYLSALLRLGFGPNVLAESAPLSRSASAPNKDAIQKQTAAATTQLLRFLSTHSAMSALSSVIVHSDSKRGAPCFIKAVSSRLLSAQLLRPDGVRSLFIITFGSSDLAEAAEEENSTGSAAPGTNSLKRFEHCARLLLTPPQGMPVEVYMPIILPNLLDILAPDLSASSNLTPPPQEQMRAAGFVLTRISERHPELFSQAMHNRVYSKFCASTPGADALSKEESESTLVVSPEELDHAVSTLSSFLLFSEPSPTFFAALFEPILPQLLTLHHFIHTANRDAGKGKVRSLESGGHADRLKSEVSKFLKTWARLVDAKHGATSLIQSIQAAEKGIGYSQRSADEHRGVFWSQEAEGISIRYGTSLTQGEQDISTLLKDLSLAALAKQISTGNNDELDLTKIAPDLSAKLGLQPDPRLLANMLKNAERKDLARFLLPSVLNIYMAQKSSSRAHMTSNEDEPSSESRSVLYLQLILQLFDAFGSDLLQGDIPATLAFIDFSLSSPSQRRQVEAEQKDHDAESKGRLELDMPFISAKPSGGRPVMPSLFNVAAESDSSALKDDEETDKKADAVEGDVPAEEDNEDDEELVSTALSLLLSLLESDPSLSSETQPMLVVIADKVEGLLDNASAEIRSLAKEAKLVLMARRNSIRGAAPTLSRDTTPTNETSAKALAFAQAQETYQEALKLLQDPILPVRAHGLVLLRRLVSDDPKAGGQHVERVDPALIPAILDIFLHAVQDEESYLYLNAVQGLAALASSGGGQTIARLVGIYVGRDDGLASQPLASREVEKRLRVGEALLQVVQRCGDAISAYVDTVVPPLLAKLRDRSLANVLRSSFVSILGTVVEAAPVAMATKGYAGQLAEVCIDIVVIEMVQQPNAKNGPVKLNVQGKRISNPDDDDSKASEEQRKLDSATANDAKIAHLRRAAMLLLTLLVRATRLQLEQPEQARLADKLSALRLPGGAMLPSISTPGQGATQPTAKLTKTDLLFPSSLLEKLKQVAAYVQARDTDAIVRTHAHDCTQHIDALSVELVHSGLALSH